VKIPRVLGQYLKNPDGLEHAYGPTGAAEAQKARAQNPERIAAGEARATNRALVLSAQALVDERRFAEAKQLLGAKLNLAAQVPEVLLLLAEAMTALGETTAARQVLDYGLELHPLDDRFCPPTRADRTRRLA